jgi:hypothetical protein
LNPLSAIASLAAASFDTTPSPDELAATVAAVDFLSRGNAESSITLWWDSHGYAAAGSRGPERTARCMAIDDPRYDSLLGGLDPDQAQAVSGTIHYETSEGRDGVGSARFRANARAASPVAPTTPLCLVSDGPDPVALAAVRFESIGENLAHYTAIVFPLGPSS